MASTSHALSDSPRRWPRTVTAPPEGPAQRSGQEPPPTRWLLLVYQVPSEPSRLRATVWRRIKRLGAVYLRKSVAAFPANEASERVMRKLCSDIVAMNGTATLLSCRVLAGEDEITAALQAARAERV